MKTNIIPKATLINICRIGHGEKCCRYITASGEGIACQKHTDIGRIIDKRVETMTAKGDNCEGL